MNNTELEQVLHTEIPLTQAMGLAVESCSTDKVILTAPLEKNINHKCTAFGGSLYSVAVLSGWCLIYTNLRAHSLSGHIVIQHSEMDYKIPVDSTLRGICHLAEDNAMQRFLTIYRKRKRARIKLDVILQHEQQIAAQFSGQYVVHD